MDFYEETRKALEDTPEIMLNRAQRDARIAEYQRLEKETAYLNSPEYAKLDTKVVNKRRLILAILLSPLLPALFALFMIEFNIVSADSYPAVILAAAGSWLMGVAIGLLITLWGRMEVE